VIVLYELHPMSRARSLRPSKSLTLAQAEAVLKTAEQGPPRMRAYIIVSLLTGRGWTDVDLTGRAEVNQLTPPNMALVRSVRAAGDTKTRKSRRALALPQRAVDAP
jgi:hypothetical protein